MLTHWDAYVNSILHCVIIHHNRDDVNAMRQCREAKNPVEKNTILHYTVKILLIVLTKYQRKAENSEIECQAGTYKDKFIIHNSDDVNEARPPLRTSTLPY